MELTSEAAALVDKDTPFFHEDEEEIPPVKKAKALAAILERIPKKCASVELTSNQQAKR